MIYFTADQHFNHRNIIKYSKRPFSTVEEMNEILLNNINLVVKKDDMLWHLGDISFGDPYPFIKAINCRTIFILEGNHDKSNRGKLNRISRELDWVNFYPSQIINRRFVGKKFILWHYPIADWDGRAHGVIHLYAHSHNNGKFIDPTVIHGAYNVGVDVNKYKPISIDEICDRIIPFDPTRE